MIYSRKGKSNNVDVTLDKKKEDKFFIDPGKEHSIFEYLDHGRLKHNLKELERDMEKLNAKLKDIEIVII